MLQRILLLTGLALLAGMGAEGRASPAPRPAQALFRLSDGAARAQSAAEPVSFGLTRVQRQRLFSLTNGAVDLRGFYRVRAADAARLRAAPGFQNAIGPIVSPLAVVGPDGEIRGDARHFPETSPGPLTRAGAMDPDLSGQWWVKGLGTEGAWRIATGRGVTIADCDTGFYLEERDLEPNMVAALRHDFADTDRPGAVDDGNFVFHGTAVAAIMTGARDGVGTNGLAYDARLVPLQNFNYDRSLDDLDKEEATARCVLGALKIPDVSVIVVQNQTAQGSSETYAGTREAIRLAVQSGVTVVSAAGNASVELTAEAADDTGSIIVGAVRQTGRMANFSNFGRRVTIAAYGENLQTLYGPAGRMDTFGGTTGATAQVGAAVALMLSANPGLSPDQVRDILVTTRRLDPSNEKVGGCLDMEAAVASARDTEPARGWRRRAHDLRRAVLAVLSEESP